MVDQVALWDYVTLTSTLLDVQVEVLVVVEVVAEQVALWDYATLTSTLLDVQVEVLLVVKWLLNRLRCGVT